MPSYTLEIDGQKRTIKSVEPLSEQDIAEQADIFEQEVKAASTPTTGADLVQSLPNVGLGLGEQFVKAGLGVASTPLAMGAALYNNDTEGAMKAGVRPLASTAEGLLRIIPDTVGALKDVADYAWANPMEAARNTVDAGIELGKFATGGRDVTGLLDKAQEAIRPKTRNQAQVTEALRATEEANAAQERRAETGGILPQLGIVDKDTIDQDVANTVRDVGDIVLGPKAGALAKAGVRNVGKLGTTLSNIKAPTTLGRMQRRIGEGLSVFSKENKALNAAKEALGVDTHAKFFDVDGATDRSFVERGDLHNVMDRAKAKLKAKGIDSRDLTIDQALKVIDETGNDLWTSVESAAKQADAALAKSGNPKLARIDLDTPEWKQWKIDNAIDETTWEKFKRELDIGHEGVPLNAGGSVMDVVSQQKRINAMLGQNAFATGSREVPQIKELYKRLNELRSRQLDDTFKKVGNENPYREWGKVKQVKDGLVSRKNEIVGGAKAVNPAEVVAKNAGTASSNQTIALAAAARGVGTLWKGSAPVQANKAVRKLFNTDFSVLHKAPNPPPLPRTGVPPPIPPRPIPPPMRPQATPPPIPKPTPTTAATPTATPPVTPPPQGPLSGAKPPTPAPQGTQTLAPKTTRPLQNLNEQQLAEKLSSPRVEDRTLAVEEIAIRKTEGQAPTLVKTDKALSASEKKAATEANKAAKAAQQANKPVKVPQSKQIEDAVATVKAAIKSKKLPKVDPAILKLALKSDDAVFIDGVQAQLRNLPNDAASMTFRKAIGQADTAATGAYNKAMKKIKAILTNPKGYSKKTLTKATKDLESMLDGDATLLDSLGDVTKLHEPMIVNLLKSKNYQVQEKVAKALHDAGYGMDKSVKSADLAAELGKWSGRFGKAEDVIDDIPFDRPSTPSAAVEPPKVVEATPAIVTNPTKGTKVKPLAKVDKPAKVKPVKIENKPLAEVKPAATEGALSKAKAPTKAPKKVKAEQPKIAKVEEPVVNPDEAVLKDLIDDPEFAKEIIDSVPENALPTTAEMKRAMEQLGLDPDDVNAYKAIIAQEIANAPAPLKTQIDAKPPKYDSAETIKLLREAMGEDVPVTPKVKKKALSNAKPPKK